MSTQQHEYQQSQQWIVVTKNRNKHKGSIKNKQIHGRGHQNILKAEFREEYIQKFMISKSFEFNKKMIGEALDKIQAISSSGEFHVECLGLGNFLLNKKCFVQLQFMELIIMPLVKQIIAKRQQIDLSQKSQRPLFRQEEFSVNVYDPAFSGEEIRHIKEMNYSSVQKYEIREGKINVFFMPHCERFLYEGVYQQYSQIKDNSLTPLIIVGNSIQQYKERCVLVKQKIPDIFIKIQVKEERIFDFENALNDSFILI